MVFKEQIDFFYQGIVCARIIWQNNYRPFRLNYQLSYINDYLRKVRSCKSLNFNRDKNVDIDGKVINQYQPVKDAYGTPIYSDNTDVNGMVKDPTKSVYGKGRSGVGFDFTELFKWILFVPGVIVALFENLLDALTPLMENLLIPSIIIVLFTLFLIPNLKYVLNEKGIKENPSRYWEMMFINLTASFVILFPIVSPILLEPTEKLANTMIDKGATDGLFINIVSVIFISLLYILRYLIITLIIPLLQFLIIKYADKRLLNSLMQSVVKKLFNL